MKGLAHRLNKLEAALLPCQDKINIAYYLYPGWTEETELRGIAEAKSHWETVNGPIGDREVELLRVQFV